MDEQLIRKILTNLLSNAVKFSKEESTVHFELIYDSKQVTFNIKDEGIGMTSLDKLNIFQPFYRAREVSHISGTGLGLAIVKNAVELHGGSINVESIVDVKTTFRVCIPTIQIKDESQ